jgi:hypothetical protein
MGACQKLCTEKPLTTTVVQKIFDSKIVSAGKSRMKAGNI